MLDGEERHLSLSDRQIEYILKNSFSAKNLRLEIHNSGKIVLVRPKFVSLDRAEKFLEDKQAWLFKKIAFFEKFGGFSGNTFKPLSRRDFLKQRLPVERLIRERLAYFNNFYNFNYNRVSVRNQKTRWGSCSRRGALNFNVRLGSLPPDLQDYIIVHELCHLKEFNHSTSFWRLVAQQIPDYLERRRQLKQLRLI